MIRPALLVAIALGFLTAFVVGELGLFVADSDIAGSQTIVQAKRAEPVVEAFYAGVNAWIADGDPSLESVLAPGFVDHTSSSAPDRNAAELLDYLSAVRTAVPSLRFDILAIEASGATVSVDLMWSPGTPSAVEGWTIALSVKQSFREILRIEKGRIAERWSSDDLWPSGSVLVEQTRPVGFEAYQQPSIQRFVLDAKGAFDLIATGTVMLWVESGELGIELSGTDQTGAIRFPADSLVPGSLRIVEPEGELRVRALGVDRVVVWTVSLDKILIPIGVGNNNVLSVIHRDAKVSLELQLPTNAIKLSLLIVSLTPGSTLSTSAASLHAVAVVSGELQAHPHTGEVFYCFDGTRSRLLNGAETALSGEGFANQRGSSATYQVAGPDPATLVLFAIHPADPQSGYPVHTGPG
jgi:predicted ester cyclase